MDRRGAHPCPGGADQRGDAPADRADRARVDDRAARRPRAGDAPTRRGADGRDRHAGPRRVYRTGHAGRGSRHRCSRKRRIAHRDGGRDRRDRVRDRDGRPHDLDLVSGGSVGKGSAASTLFSGGEQRARRRTSRTTQSRQQQQKQEEQSPASRRAPRASRPRRRPSPRRRSSRRPTPRRSPPPTETPPGEPVPERADLAVAAARPGERLNRRLRGSRRTAGVEGVNPGVSASLTGVLHRQLTKRPASMP